MDGFVRPLFLELRDPILRRSYGDATASDDVPLVRSLGVIRSPLLRLKPRRADALTY